MLSFDDIVLPDTGETRCGITTHMINPDINFDNPIILFNKSEKFITIYNMSECKILHMDDLKQIGQLLIEHNKIVLEIDVAGWFSHIFTLYNTKEGIYVVERYIYQKMLEKHPFDLDKLYEMLLEVDKYVGFYEREGEYFDCQTKLTMKCKSNQTFDQCGKVWYDFGDAYHISGSRGLLDYYTIKCFTPIINLVN